jgi:hypothetical protein
MKVKPIEFLIVLGKIKPERSKMERLRDEK